MRNAGDFNAVLAAQSLNPSIFTQIWLAKHGLFEEKDFDQPNSMYTPIGVNVPTPDLLFVAIPEKVQVAFTEKREDPAWCQAALHRTLGVIAEKLHHTPFQAVGFNMEWHVKAPTPAQALTLERQQFLADLNPLAKYFQGPDCRFGCYLSQPFILGRLKFDMKPITYTDTSEGMRLLFNFHHDLTEDKQNQISKFLDLWQEAYRMALKYASELEETWA
jgi:hypothetical protein